MRNWQQKLLFGSFAAFTTLTALMWLVVPGRFASLIVGAGGAYAIDIGRARGASDLAIGLLAWSGLRLPASQGRQAIFFTLALTNALMLVAGTIAQMQEIATPGRLVVYFAHVGWAIAFGSCFVRGGGFGAR